MGDAVVHEKEFVCEALAVDLIGMNSGCAGGRTLSPHPASPQPLPVPWLTAEARVRSAA